MMSNYICFKESKLTGVLFEYNNDKLVVSLCKSDTVYINYIILLPYIYLIHGSDATAACNHSNIFNFTWLHLFLLCLRVSYLKLRVTLVYYVTADCCYSHFRAFLHPINKLSKEAALWMFKVSQVDLDKKVNVASISDLGQWMIISLMFFYFTRLLIHYICFKLQILTCLMSQRPLLVWQCESVHECVCRQLFSSNEGDFNRCS
jgi:hypothetical protein